MLIPSIDLMGGKIVQLVQGKKKALEFDDPEPWIRRFQHYPLIQLIDLDAAIGTGNNTLLATQIARRLPCQLGGGIRSLNAAQQALAAGARRVIIGSALFTDGNLNLAFAHELALSLGPERLVFALDAIAGRVTIHGWRKQTAVTPLEMLQALGHFCGAFLYTHVDSEGLLQGFPHEVIRPLRQATARQLIAAGGIRSQQEIDDLHAIGVDAVVGMALYQGLIPTSSAGFQETSAEAPNE
ncbi:MAG TPA: HisA/HisF-related TIM barrel protein [Candidatus Sulfotelmatobacter sp.]|nr:HisA/HisF-related TIM barrel protein [Candidatus Sulfotelmatobacter sp.]